MIMQILKNCVFTITIFVIVLFLSAVPSLAADYSVRQIDGKSGACFSKNKRVSGARFCHNCKSSGGDNVRWQFQVYCEGKPTEKILRAHLSCKQSIPKEGKQLRMLYDQANEIMDDNLHNFYSFRDCNYAGWPK